MRQSPFLVAALLAFTMLAPGAALAFDMQTTGAMSADGSTKYADPEESLDKAPLGTITTGPSLQFSKSGPGTSTPTYDRPVGYGWQELQPTGRLTR
jgi:hypothetical protein